MAEEEGEDEDDYLTMSFEDPAISKRNETLTQKKKRQAREAEERSRPKSKNQLAEEERIKREEALQKSSMDAKSKGYKMMAALGYQAGTALGADRAPEQQGGVTDDRILEPIGLEMRQNRSGIGADSEKKRKIREAFENQDEGEKRQKIEAEEFRDRQRQEREDARAEGQFWGAMKVAERLDEEDIIADTTRVPGKPPPQSRNLGRINVLWRGLVRDRQLKERDKRMRYDLHQSLSRLPTYDDPKDDEEDRLALGKTAMEETDVELDQDDPELDDFQALDIQERLKRIVIYLREHWHYCFWCKYRYTDIRMEGCPGSDEDDHD